MIVREIHLIQQVIGDSLKDMGAQLLAAGHCRPYCRYQLAVDE